MSKHILQCEKEDVAYALIGDLQKGDEISRVQLAIYCLKDAYLPLMMIDKLIVKGWDSGALESEVCGRLSDAIDRQALERPKISYYKCSICGKQGCLPYKCPKKYAGKRTQKEGGEKSQEELDKLVCSLCGRKRHTAQDCYYKDIIEFVKLKFLKNEDRPPTEIAMH